MTLVTIGAVVDIASHIGVIEIGSVVVAMATRALEHGVVTRVRMASRADTVGVAVIGREIGVIKRRTSPCGGRVAGIAGGGEAGRLMVWIGGVVVVGLMAAHARCRQRGVVVVDVAHHAGDGRRRMESGERESRIVVIERCARPIRGAVARVAGGRETGGSVRRGIGAVVVGLVARDAGGVRCREVVIPIHVALRARHG